MYVLCSSSVFAAVQLAEPSYQVNVPITVTFSNFPGNKQDWITLIPKGTPDNQYGEWFYTGGRASADTHSPENLPDSTKSERISTGLPGFHGSR